MTIIDCVRGYVDVMQELECVQINNANLLILYGIAKKWVNISFWALATCHSYQRIILWEPVSTTIDGFWLIPNNPVR